ncbi:MAG: MarR family transcriptional regulator [Halobaculum sp.]
MPISGDQFERLEEGESDDPARAILGFLREHSDEAYTGAEIAEATELSEETVGAQLGRLHERGRVDHRGEYWRVSDHERAVDAAAALTTQTVDTREEEPPSYNDWQEYAVDPRDDE